MGKEHFIFVTHFINPQLFWYHKVYVSNESFNKIAQLEQKLSVLYKNNSALLHYYPKTNDLVAVYLLSWNKFIRARVDTKSNISGTTSAFIVWAVDYGFPFETSLEHIRKIPASFGKFIDHVQCGGLAFVMPGEKEFDFMEGKSKMCKQEHWSQRACECLEKLIIDATSVTFIEEFQTDTSRFWGDLKIVNRKGYTFLASDYLVGIDMAVEDKLSFRESALTLNINTPPWLSNNGNCKYIHNVENCFEAYRRMRNGADSDDDNVCAAKNTKLLLTDIFFPDKREGLMSSGSAPPKSIEPSPKPAASALAANTEGTQLPITSENSMLGKSSSVILSSLPSSRTQRLIEARKKLALKQLDKQSKPTDSAKTITASYQEYPHLNKSSFADVNRAFDVVAKSQIQRLKEFRGKVLAKKAEGKQAVNVNILQESTAGTSEFGEKLSNNHLHESSVRDTFADEQLRRKNNNGDDMLSTTSSGAFIPNMETPKNSRKEHKDEEKP